MIFEVRNCYFEPTRFDVYKVGAQYAAMAYPKRNLNVFGFRANTDMKPQINARAIFKNVPGGLASYPRTECTFPESST